MTHGSGSVSDGRLARDGGRTDDPGRLSTLSLSEPTTEPSPHADIVVEIDHAISVDISEQVR